MLLLLSQLKEISNFFFFISESCYKLFLEVVVETNYIEYLLYRYMHKNCARYSSIFHTVTEKTSS